jgi:hypothetical protein
LFGSVVVLRDCRAIVLRSDCTGSRRQHAGNARYVASAHFIDFSSNFFLRAFDAFVFRSCKSAVAAAQLLGAQGPAKLSREFRLCIQTIRTLIVWMVPARRKARPGLPSTKNSNCTRSRCHNSKVRNFMKTFFGASLIVLTVVLPTVASKAQQPAVPPAMPGMTMSSDDKQKEAEIQAALAKLKPEDRKLAEAQKFCAVLTKNRLGTMGTPIKVTIKDKPVFLCCKNCQAKATANPDKTLATLTDLLKANKKEDAKKPDSTKS